jgi:hypothetical protein
VRVAIKIGILYHITPKAIVTFMRRKFSSRVGQDGILRADWQSAH